MEEEDIFEGANKKFGTQNNLVAEQKFGPKKTKTSQAEIALNWGYCCCCGRCHVFYETLLKPFLTLLLQSKVAK